MVKRNRSNYADGGIHNIRAVIKSADTRFDNRYGYLLFIEIQKRYSAQYLKLRKAFKADLLNGVFHLFAEKRKGRS